MKIPQKHTDCTYCVLGGSDSLDWPGPNDLPPESGLCEHHRGEDGRPMEFTGYDAYEPTEWVTQVVGTRYKAWDKRTYLCTGYDPRSGFWMRTVDDGKPRITNVSERAINRTYHEVRLTWGAFRMLELTGSLDRFPTKEEAEGIWYDHARENLIRCGFLTPANSITPEGVLRLDSGEPI